MATRAGATTDLNVTFPLPRLIVAVLAGALLAFAVSTACAGSARAADYVPNQVVVGYRPGPVPSVTQDLATRMGVRAVAAAEVDSRSVVVDLPPGVTVEQTISKLRQTPGIAYAVPNFIAHAAGVAPAGWIPNDPGRGHARGGWQKVQWNFLPGAGINAPRAWANLNADHRPGGRGVVIAVLDTGIAYRNWRQYHASPDFGRTRFVSPYDFVGHDPYPLDREGHGTFVAGTIAESTDNGISLTGLAYGASIMPVRVLNGGGTGNAATIAQGVRYAVSHHAQVINLSLEFDPATTAADIPDLLDAIHYAVSQNVVVVAAAGNDYTTEVAYPARDASVISVGASTLDRCAAGYSDTGSRLDLVAPGGGGDAPVPSDPDCHPGRRLPPIYQLTLLGPTHPNSFGLPGGYVGTSMSTPHVAAAAALVIASGVLGSHPTPDQIRARLEQTAQPLGGTRPNAFYGWGLLDVGAATARGG
jgi:serine protease